MININSFLSYLKLIGRNGTIETKLEAIKGLIPSKRTQHSIFSLPSVLQSDSKTHLRPFLTLLINRMEVNSTLADPPSKRKDLLLTPFTTSMENLKNFLS
jgi:hypothetical protein